MVEFNFFAGGGPSEGLSSLLAQSVQGAQQNAALRFAAVGQGLQTALSGLQSGLAMRDATLREDAARRFAEKMADANRRADSALQQANLDFQRQQQERGQEFSATQADIERSLRQEEAQRSQSMGLLQILGRMGEAAAGQGFPVPELTRRLMEFGGSLPGMPVGTMTSGQQGLPGVPGGFLQEPQGSQDPINLAMRQGSYQGLAGGGASDPFGGMQPMPQPPSVEQQRFEYQRSRDQLSDQEKQQVSSAALQIRRLQAQQDKNVVVQEDTTYADALGLGDLDDAELEAAVLDKFPTLRPAKGLDGKEGDRRALDAKLKWLTKPRKVSIPNGAGLTGLDWTSVGGNPTIIHAAMEEVYGQEYNLPMTPEEFRAAANQKLLSQIPDWAIKFQPAQIQGGEDLLSALSSGAKQENMVAATGTPGPGLWNKSLADQLGVDLAQYPELMNAAMAPGGGAGGDGWPVKWEGDRLVFSKVGKQSASPRMQAALDELMKDPAMRRRVEAKFAVGAGVKQTPTELDVGAQARKSMVRPGESSKPAPQAPAASPQKPAPAQQQAAPQAPAKSALEKYRESKSGKKAPEPRKSHPMAGSMYGLVPDELMQLLLGAGGGG